MYEWLIVIGLGVIVVAVVVACYVAGEIQTYQEQIHSEFAAVHRDTMALLGLIRDMALQSEADSAVLRSLHKRSECWWQEAEHEKAAKKADHSAGASEFLAGGE